MLSGSVSISCWFEWVFDPWLLAAIPGYSGPCERYVSSIIGYTLPRLESLVQKLNLEHQWFPSLVQSLLAITGRSENQELRNKTQALVKVEGSHLFYVDRN